MGEMIMKDRPNLNDLSKEIYEANKKKGFHDKEHSNEHYLMLVITELSEAVEADRKRKRYRDEEYKACLNYYKGWSKESIGYKIEETTAFTRYIKDTLEDELADAIIRLLDLAGLGNWEINANIQDTYTESIDSLKVVPLTYSIFKIVETFYHDFLSTYGKVLKAIPRIEALAHSLQIDIWQHVELKIEYNATRERLHGKLY